VQIFQDCNHKPLES